MWRHHTGRTNSRLGNAYHAHKSTPNYDAPDWPEIALLRVVGHWLPNTLTATSTTSAGAGRSTYKTTATADRILTTREQGSDDVGAPPNKAYRRRTLPITLTPVAVTPDLADRSGHAQLGMPDAALDPIPSIEQQAIEVLPRSSFTGAERST